MTPSNPGEGTLQLFPLLKEGISYVMMRPLMKDIPGKDAKCVFFSWGNYILDWNCDKLINFIAKNAQFSSRRQRNRSWPKSKVNAQRNLPQLYSHLRQTSENGLKKVRVKSDLELRKEVHSTLTK